jgi:cytochrome c oxidase assembly factor CtaG
MMPLLGVAYAISLRVFPAPLWRVASFAAGWLLALAVQITPLDTLAVHYLLVMHLLQNVALAEWAPALCVLGLSPLLVRAAERLAPIAFVTQPLPALAIWLGTYFAWHLPWPYDAALRHSGLIHLEHLTYFVAGCLLWWPVIHGRRSSGAKAAYLFGAFVLASPLGLLLALLPSSIYSFYQRAPRLWGLSPLTDQQLAGVAMSAEQAVVFFFAFAFYLARFLREEEHADAFRTPTART